MTVFWVTILLDVFRNFRSMRGRWRTLTSGRDASWVAGRELAGSATGSRRLDPVLRPQRAAVRVASLGNDGGLTNPLYFGIFSG
jgi:hypothetical protein